MLIKKYVASISLGLVFVGTAVGAVVLFRVLKDPKPFLTISSPQGTYVIQFTGDRERPKFPLVNHHVAFSVIRNQQVYVASKVIHSCDWLDKPFDFAYPDHRWLSENTLQLYNARRFNAGQADRIRVINKTLESVQQLRVKSDDSFLVFDIQPGSTTILPLTVRRGDFRWIKVEGGFSKGGLIKPVIADFDIESNSTGPFTYDILIDENGASIVQIEKNEQLEPWEL